MNHRGSECPSSAASTAARSGLCLPLGPATSVKEQVVADGLPTDSKDLIDTLSSIPSPEEFLAAPADLASNLVELRQIPRWWEWIWEPDEEEE